jgi:DNA-binding LacI/PurR family transcriptional regulator
MMDVARVAGVSQKTVSRVVNGAAEVRPEVRARVLRVIDELGYRRNGAARALVTSRTHVLGVVALGSALYGPSRHVIAVERSARNLGYGVVVVSTEEGPTADVPAAIERALALGAEGVVLIEPLFDVQEHLRLFETTPLVTASPALSDAPRYSTVDTDEEQGARLATEHLLDLGHANVSHIGGPVTWRSAVLRERGWRTVLRAHGIKAPTPVLGDWTARSGYFGMQELLARGRRTTAVFCANDQMAMGAMRALYEAGLRIPEDFSVVGFDDLPESEFQVVPLTTVRQNFDEIARISVLRLIEIIERADRQEPAVTVPVTLVPRASSGPPPKKRRLPGEATELVHRHTPRFDHHEAHNKGVTR